MCALNVALTFLYMFCWVDPANSVAVKSMILCGHFNVVDSDYTIRLSLWIRFSSLSAQHIREDLLNIDFY